MNNNALKIAYISGLSCADVDISYLRYASRLSDITYFLPIYKEWHSGPVFNEKFIPRNGIFKATDLYPSFKKWENWIDIDKFFVINSNATHTWYPHSVWLTIKMLFRLRQFDVIHLASNPLLPSEWGYYLYRDKIVQTLHDPLPHSDSRFNTLLWSMRRKMCFLLLNHFIILNNKQKEECILVNKLQHKHLYESMLSRYDCLQENLKVTLSNSTQTAPYFLFFGNIGAYKGIDILLESMRQVHTQYPSMRLIIAGKGEFSFDISEYKKLEYIEFRNRFIPDDELAALIQGSYAVVCPYKDATQSGVVMSAFAFNKPVIATRVGGLPEQVLHERYGLIVPPCNVDGLAVAMSSLCEHPEKAQAFSHNIEQDYAEGSKSWKAIARQMLEIYQQVYKSNS